MIDAHQRFTEGLSRTGVVAAALALVLLATLASPPSQVSAQEAEDAHFDVLLRNGTVFDGSGADRYEADVGITGDRITAVGDLDGATASREIDVEGLFVAPGFVNGHSHGSPDVMANARNMLTQGVTIEVLNPDGGGPANIEPQLEDLEDRPLAVNAGVQQGFGGVWGEVVGEDNRRPSEDEIAEMRDLVSDGMESGAWAVSSNLESPPSFFAETEEVAAVVAGADGWRSTYQSHIRSEFSGLLEATEEAVEIGESAGLAPMITHMKVGGPPNWGRSVETLAVLHDARDRGIYAASDQYPYLAGQCSLNRFVPPWVQDGGLDAMLDRFADPELRPQIRDEITQRIEEWVGCSDGALLPERGQTLAEVADEMGVSPAEAVMRVFEEEQRSFVRLIYFWGQMDDVVRILQDPYNAVSCDCGSTESESTHPRNYGSYPKVLGEFVREQNLITYEEAIRKMTALPATQLGMVDRGLIAEGMLADVTVFDPETVTDHATYDDPRQYSEGIEYVLVNGRVALEEGELTGVQAGEVQRRTANMPTRPYDADRAVSVSVSGTFIAEDPGGRGRSPFRISLSSEQDGGPTTASGEFELVDRRGRDRFESVTIGQMQATDVWTGHTGGDWASLTGVGRTASGELQPFLVIVEEDDPALSDPGRATGRARPQPTVTVHIGDDDPITGTLRPHRSVDVDLE